MKTEKSQVYFLLMSFLCIGALTMFLLSPLVVDHLSMSLAFVFVFTSLIYFFYIRKLAGLQNNAFSLTFLFVLAFLIVFFQFPLDVLLSSFSSSSLYYTVIYDEYVLVKSIWYLVCFLILLFLGMHFQVNKEHIMSHREKVYRPISSKPFYFLFYLFFILHLITVDPGYYKGEGVKELQGIANSVLGYFIILLPVCFGVTIYNYKLNNNGVFNCISYLKLFPLLFIVIVLLFSFLTFLAGDRGPAIRALILLVFGYYIVTNKSVSYLKFCFMIVVAGFFLSTIKLVGAISYNDNLIDSFLAAAERLNNSSKVESISPYTAELSASFRAYNTAFSLWYSGHSLYGLGVITGFLMSIPYAVTVFMEVFDLNKIDINSSHAITTHVSESYGLGTSLVGDALLNTGFFIPLLLAFLIGRLFVKIDYSFFVNQGSVYIYTIGMYYLMGSVSLARGSIFPTLGSSLFIVFLVFFVSTVLSRSKAN